MKKQLVLVIDITQTRADDRLKRLSRPFPLRSLREQPVTRGFNLVRPSSVCACVLYLLDFYLRSCTFAASFLRMHVDLQPLL